MHHYIYIQCTHILHWRRLLGLPCELGCGFWLLQLKTKTKTTANQTLNLNMLIIEYGKQEQL